MGDRSRADKHASVDSGLGLADEHTDTIGLGSNVMQSEMNTHVHNNNLPNTSFLSPTCSSSPVTRPTSIPLSSLSSEFSDENSESSTSTSRLPRNNDVHVKFTKKDEQESARTTSPSSGMRGLIKESICKDGVCFYNFGLKFYGLVELDKRITQPMLPWIVAEKCRNNKHAQNILLQISGKGAIGISESQGLILFDHRPTCVSRFSRGHDKKSFGYLWRPNSETNFKCFVFSTLDSEMIQNVVAAVRDATRDALMEQSSTTNTDNEAAIESLRENSSTMYEVLYCGRLAVSHKRAPPSLIDDTIEKFKQHECDLNKKKLSTMRKRHYSAGDQDAPELEENKNPVTSHSVDSKQSMMSQSVDEKSISDDSSSVSSDSSINIPHNVFLGKDAFYNVVKEEMRIRAGSTGSKPTENRGRCESDCVNQLSPETGHNRTMLFQIGKIMLTLISPDQKSFMLNKRYKDISFCSQGIQQPEYFGFICREKSSNSNYMCYVFKCQSEPFVDSIMGTLRQAFNTALANSRLHVICETCPMHQLHKLCEQVQGQIPDKVHATLNKQLQTLTETQRDMIHNKLKLLKPKSQQDWNELVVSMLLCVCEEQQKIHVHIGEGSNDSSPNNERKTSTEKPKEIDSRFKKAKKSLASSFENLLNRTKPRSGSDKLQEDAGETSPESTGFANSGYNSRRGTMTDMGLQDKLQKKVTGKPVVESPSHTPRDSPVPSAPSPLRTSSPTVLVDEEKSPIRRRPNRMSTEETTCHEWQKNTPGRPRSKTLGSLPSPGEGPVVDRIFTTPSFKKPEGHGRKPLVRAMSFDERASPMSPRTPGTTPSRRASWRQAIFQRVVTPMAESKPGPGIVEEEEEAAFKQSRVGTPHILTPPRFTTKESIHAMWRKAIMEQILLIRMDKENKHLKARQDAAKEKRIKLNYEELNPCLKIATREWEKLLLLPNWTTTKIDEDHLNQSFKLGVPRTKRGEIWMLLAAQYKLRNPSIAMATPDHEPYAELLKELTTHQHSILIDLGRTFPTHAYFVNPLGRGQLSLFNLLKAFSLLDEEVGYCQGLSFVAGVLLMHMDEEEAFEMLVYLMFGLGFRRQYRPDMTSLQIQMYQLERLLHDHHRRLHDHLQRNDIAPSLYAAPWFLTLFASQFPLGFVSKVFDLIYLQGFDVIFKVALLILGIHEELLLACRGFEDTIEFLKNNLPTLGVVQMEKVVKEVWLEYWCIYPMYIPLDRMIHHYILGYHCYADDVQMYIDLNLKIPSEAAIADLMQAFSMDISKELHSFEVEYHIFQEEMIPTPLQQNHSADADSLERANRNLRRQNNQLLEQLQTAHNAVHNQEATISSIRKNESDLKNEIRNLNLEREALLNTVSKLHTLIPENVLQDAGINFTAPIYQNTSRRTDCNIGLAELKRLNQEAKDVFDEDDEVECITRNRDSRRASSQRSSDSSISNISSDIDSPMYSNKH